MASLFEPPDAPAAVPRRRSPPRLDHALLVAGAAIMTIGSFMPWIQGQTRRVGYVDWRGIDDTGEGGMLLALGIVILVFVRLRSNLEEIEPRTRWLPFVLAVAAAFLWIIPYQKITGLIYDAPGGARPQLGLFVAGIGVLFTLVGGALAGRSWAEPDTPPRRRAVRREKAPIELPPGSDGYATRARVERRDSPRDR